MDYKSIIFVLVSLTKSYIQIIWLSIGLRLKVWSALFQPHFHIVSSHIREWTKKTSPLANLLTLVAYQEIQTMIF